MARVVMVVLYAMGTDVDRFGYLRVVNCATLGFAFLFSLKGVIDGVPSCMPFPDSMWLLAMLILMVGLLPAGLLWRVSARSSFVRAALPDLQS
jgi:hypothetical protein